MHKQNNNCFVLVIVLILLLAGCSPHRDAREKLSLPEPVDGIEFTVPSKESALKRVSLYYPSADLQSLQCVYHDLAFDGYRSKALVILESLLQGDGGKDVRAVLGEAGRIGWVMVSRGLAVVDIVGDFDALSQREIFAGTVAIVNTLVQLPDIDYVKLSLNGEDQGGTGVLANPMRAMEDDLLPLWLEHQSYLSTGEGRKAETASKSVFYFLDRSGSFLLAEVRGSYHDTEDDIADIISDLKSGPVDLTQMKPSIEENVNLLGKPDIYVDEEGRTVLTLMMGSPEHEIMDNKARHRMAGAIVLSIQSQRPDIDIVRIWLNNRPIIDELRMDSGMFVHYIGNVVPIYFPDEQHERLVGVQRAMSQQRYYRPIDRLRELLGGVKPGDSSKAGALFSNSVSEDVILGMDVYDDYAVVNLSSDFPYNAEQGIQAERMMVYAIVNTLCAFDNIDRVLFIVDGRRVSSIGYLSLENPLLPNPGIIAN